MDEIANRDHWASILRRQKQANVERWLRTLAADEATNELVIRDYDNLLRALEDALATPESFTLAYDLVRRLYPLVFGFADWERWLAYLEQALVISRAIGQEEEEAHLLNLMANILVQQGNLSLAEQYFQESAALFKQREDLLNYGKLLSKLSHICGLKGDFLSAEAHCQEALAIAQIAQDKHAIGVVYLDLSHIYLKSESWTLALEAAEKASKIFRALGKQRSGLGAEINQIYSLSQMGDWEEAERLATGLMATLAELSDSRTMIQLKNNLGVAAFSQGDFAKAELWWQEALQLNSQVQNPLEMASLYNNLGMVYTRLEDWETAVEMLQCATNLYEELGDVSSWANAVDNLAELYTLKGETAVAQQLLHQAIDKLETEEGAHHQELLDMINGRFAGLVHQPESELP